MLKVTKEQNRGSKPPLGSLGSHFLAGLNRPNLDDAMSVQRVKPGRLDVTKSSPLFVI
jgi:hypothetical protein